MNMTDVSGRFGRRRFLASVGLATVEVCIGGSCTAAAMANASGDMFSGDDLDEFIRACMEAAYVPGLSLAFIRDGRLHRATGFGFANMAHQ